MFTFSCFGLFCKMMIFLIWEVFLENQFLQHVYYHVYNHSPKFYIFLNLFDIFKQCFKISSKTEFSGNVSFRSTGQLTIRQYFSRESSVDRSGRPRAQIGRPTEFPVDRRWSRTFSSCFCSHRSTDGIFGRPTI